MSTETATDDGGRSMGRRTFIRGIGATAAAGAALSGTGGKWAPVGRSEAIFGTVVGSAVGSQVTEWALRKFTPLGSRAPDSGLTASALKQDIYETGRTRRSTNASTFVDNRNIINSGLENTLYVDGKVPAIEALNAQKTQAEVETAAMNGLKDHAATVERNLMKSWNESVNELETLFTTATNHGGVDEIAIFTGGRASVSGSSYPISPDDQGIRFGSRSVTLTDGSSFDVRTLEGKSDSGTWDPATISSGLDGDAWVALRDGSDDPKIAYMRFKDWNGVWSDLQTAISNVKSGLTNWVATVYNDVQAGSIDVSDLITPQERAEMMSDSGAGAQAIADLQALGFAVDAEHEVTVTLDSTSATLRGTLGLSDSSQSIEAGESYTPSATTFSGDAYLTYDVSTGEGTWSAFNEGVDGGVATFTEEPYEKTLFRIDTTDDETVEVTRSDFAPVGGSGNEVDPATTDPAGWEVDLSDQLSNAITNIDHVRFFADVDETTMETIRLTDTFTIDSIVNTETDEEVDTASFEQPTAQNDQNYITQEEWDELEQQNKELIEKYEEQQEQQNSGLLPGGFPDLGTIGGASAVGGVAVVGGVFVIAKKALDIYLPGR